MRVFILLATLLALTAARAAGTAKLFGPGVISGPAHDSAPALAVDRREVWFSRSDGKHSTILASHLDGGRWSAPRPASFSGKWSDMEPAMSSDGRFMVFVSNRPADGVGAPLDGHFMGKSFPGGGGNLWRVERAAEGWSAPVRLPDAINSDSSAFAPSIAADGSLWFMHPVSRDRHFRLYRAPWRDHRFEAPRPLPFSDGTATDVDPAMAAAPATYLAPVFHAGERFDNVFSRTIAYRAAGFDENVRRVSGSASYRVIDGSTIQPRLRIDYRYDGLQQGSGTVEFREGGAISCFNGKCAPNTDASGLAWNPRLWGTPPATLRIGQSWSVDIAAPWELGPPGTQKVTVIALDPASQRITLLREGSGEGAYLDDKLAITLTRDGQSWPVTVQSGRSHWYGYTTFRAGVVASDELMVERPVTLISDKLGHIAASQREYILLNAMPLSPHTDRQANHR